MKNINIVIHLSGGIVQAVVCDTELSPGIRFFICDSDTDGADPKDDKLALMDDGAKCFFRAIDIDPTTPEEFRSYVPVNWKPE